MRLPLILLFALLACGSLHAAELKPETAAAFDRYVKAAEDEMAQHRGFGDFLWMDRHRDKKSIVWLGQSALEPLQTGQPDVPGGLLQHWLGMVYIEGATLDMARNIILNFADYKTFFKQQVIDSKLIKREGDQFDFQLRLYKKQLSAVLLNVDETAKFTSLDSSRVLVASHSTHIGESEHPKNKKEYDKERKPADESGYLWRLNLYWRLEQADNGVYAELETISLGRDAGTLSPGRILTGFQTFPQELTRGMIDGLRGVFPRRH
jgi:hypothetical protein